MIYKEFKVGEKVYKLRLSAAACVETEKQLGKSILSVLMDMAPDKQPTGKGSGIAELKTMSLPLVGDIVTILHGALQKFHHEMTLAKTYDLYDEYIDAGGSYMDFFTILQDVLQVSGFLPKAATLAADKQVDKSAAAPAA